MKAILAGLIGLGLTTALALGGSFVGLIGTQGLHGDEPFLKVFLFVAGVLVVVNGVAAAVGMLPVLLVGAARSYRAAIVAAMAGGLVAALLFTTGMEAVLRIPTVDALLI